MTYSQRRALAIVRAEKARVGIQTHHGSGFTLAASSGASPLTFHGFSFVNVATHHGAVLTLPEGVGSVSFSRDDEGNLILRFDA